MAAARRRQRERARRQRDAHPRVDRPAGQRQPPRSAPRPSDNVSVYAAVASGSPALQVNDSATGSALATLAPSVAGDAHYVVVAYESGGVLRTTVIAEDTAAPAAGTASLRVFDAATDAGAIDIYVTDPAADITTLSSPTFSFAAATSLQASGFLSIAPGTYRVRVTGSGNPLDLRLDMPAVTLTNQQVAALFLAPTIGGTLVNGAALAQQGAYTAGRNTSARVRLAAAVTSAATVSANAGGARDRRQRRRAFGRRLRARPGGRRDQRRRQRRVGRRAGGGAHRGQRFDAAGLRQRRGADGQPDRRRQPPADDERQPKLRLVNGLTGAASPLTLDAAFAVIASNVVPGTASPYAVVASSTALRVDVFSPASLTPIYSDPALSVPGNAVYTLFMLGDAATPIPLLRRDR